MSKDSDHSRSIAHFERLYRENPDPWNFSSSVYEQQKYEATVAALGTRQFTVGLEVGCSIGVLTERLASHCDRLLGVDFVPAAVAAARARCSINSNVRIEVMQVPQQWPEGQFDLIVFSEMLYFLSESDLKLTCLHAIRSMLPRGQVLLVNYTGPTDDPHSGQAAATLFMDAAMPYLEVVLQRREPHYRLDLLQACKRNYSRMPILTRRFGER